LIVAFAAVARAAGAQTISGRVSGTVVDATGALVPAVHVTASDVPSGRRWEAQTDENGYFTFPSLPPSWYRILAERDGFKTFVGSPFPLASGGAVRLDILLAVGARDERIDVIARATPVSTESPAVAFSIRDRDVVDWPANGRNFLTLTLALPGIVTANPFSFSTGQRTTSGGRPFVNGNRAEANNLLLDGVDNNQTTENLVAYQAAPDAIEEIRVITSNPPAEFGNSQGAIFNVVLKSGAGEPHGSLFEFLRDDALNAAPWSANGQPLDPLNPRRKPEYRHHVFGGTAGGPIRRERVFYFADYQGTRRRSGETTDRYTVIPPAMQHGDLSSLLQSTAPIQLFDPLTARPDPADPTRTIRSPFPNNQIPIDRIDPVARALFASSFYPNADPAAGSDKTFVRTRSALVNDQFDIKIDARLRSQSDIVARYSGGIQRTIGTSSIPILLSPGSRSPLTAALLQWTGSLRSNLVAEVRAGFNQITLRTDNGADSDALGSLGEGLGIAGANRRVPGLPAIRLSGVTDFGTAKVVQDFGVTTLQYQGNVAWQSGQHGFKAGGLVLPRHENVYFSGNNGQLGAFDFNGQYTRDLTDPRSTGSPIADFLLGYPYRIVRGDFSDIWRQRSTLWAAFLQDDWRATSNLLLQLGLRYEFRTPLIEKHDRQVNFDLSTGKALFAGVDGNSRGLYDAYKLDFQPRLGFAWRQARWRGTYVLRGAYGISSFLEGTGTNLRLTLNPPFFNEFEFVNSNPAVPGPKIEQGFDALRAKDPLTGTILRAWDPHLRPARSHQWNATIESTTWPHLTLSAAYVGQYGTHLVVPVNFDQRVSPNEPPPFDAAYPQISGVILTAPNANMRYDALQLFAQKRLADGWTLTGSYTLGRALSHGRGFFSHGGQGAEAAAFWPNPRDREADWGSAPGDLRHNLAVAMTWQLPWGRGRTWLTDAPKWLNAAVGGWSASGTWRAHSGFPVTVFAPDQSLTGARGSRPDLTGEGHDLHTVGLDGQWFDTSVYTLPALGQFGTAGVGTERGPGLNVIDLSVRKGGSLAPRLMFDVGATAFNLCNNPAFDAPDRSLTSPNFGKVTTAQLAREVELWLRLRF
jgi:hypothetical protein